MLLIAVCLAAASAVLPAGVHSEQLQGYFDSVSADAAVCSASTAGTSVVATRTRLECAAMASSSDSWRSFSFADGACVVSDSPNCTAVGATVIFMKKTAGTTLVAESTQTSTAADAANSSISAPTTQSTETPSLPPTTSTPSATIGYEKVVDDRRFWVCQQRQTGAVDFGRNWTDYEAGFGNSDDFWCGLQTLRNLTAPGNRTLRMEAFTVNSTYYVSEWSNFTVGNANTSYLMQYNLHLIAKSNVSGDCMTYSKGNKFSTFDRDNDLSVGDNLSVKYANSGFWYGIGVVFTPNALYSSTSMLGNATFVSCYFIYSVISPNSFATIRTIRLMVQI